MKDFVPSPDVVRDAQNRLRALGHETLGDPAGSLGAHTRIALQAFQRQRGLAITGYLDLETWNRLVEAGWTMGERLLYEDRPFQRGDDVATLQESLALLGFNPGRIDGIFGPLTARALADFQGNCALEPTGVLTRSTLNELTRLSSRSPDRRPVTETRDSTGLLGEHRRRVVVVHGRGPTSDALARSLSRHLSVVSSGSRTDHECAALANGQNAGLVIALSENPLSTAIDVAYFASYRSHSVVGQQLADAVAKVVSARCAANVDVRGMSVPLLRETMMPAVIVAVGREWRLETAIIVEAIRSATVDLFDKAR